MVTFWLTLDDLERSNALITLAPVGVGEGIAIESVCLFACLLLSKTIVFESMLVATVCLSVCLCVCLSVRTHKSKTIDRIDLNFLHKVGSTGSSKMIRIQIRIATS